MTLDQILAGVIIVAAPFALLVLRITRFRDGISLEDLFTRPDAMPWPRGVQEEEPVRWRIERLTPRGSRAPEAAALRRTLPSRPRAMHGADPTP